MRQRRQTLLPQLSTAAAAAAALLLLLPSASFAMMISSTSAFSIARPIDIRPSAVPSTLLWASIGGGGEGEASPSATSSYDNEELKSTLLKRIDTLVSV